MRDYASGKISLSKVFAESIHLPLRREDTGVYPLYQHKYGSETARRTQRSNAWHTDCKSNLNSPSNIRLVCLDQSEAFVSYWSLPIVRGRKHEVSKPLHSGYEDGGLRVLLDPYMLTSDSAGLGCIARNYVCSNIEELWVSAELFGIAGNRNDAYADFYKRLSTLKPGQVVSTNELLKFLEFETKRNVRETFPLLRSIVVVVKPPERKQMRFCEYAQRTETIATYLNETYPNERKAIGEVPELMQRIASDSGFGFAVCTVPGADMLKFSLGDYRYDDELLGAVKEQIVKKYTKKESRFVDESLESKLSKDVEEGAGSSLLQILASMEQAGYSTASINTALFAYRQTGIDFLKAEVFKLPSELLDKYSASLGGDLIGLTTSFDTAKDRKRRLTELAKLATEPHTEHLHAMLLSAYTEDGELNTAYIEKYKSVYDALFDLSTAMVVKSRLARDGYESGNKVQEIRVQRKFGTNADIVPLIAAMQFSLECGNPSGFMDFDAKDDADLYYDASHIIEQAVARALVSFEQLYADVYSPTKQIKGAYCVSVQGYGGTVVCHNTARNTARKGLVGSDSVLKLEGLALDCVRLLYSKTKCNAVVITDSVKDKRLCLESGAVNADTLGSAQNYYFPRQAGRFASGVVIGRQVRNEDKDSFIRAVRKWLLNRLTAVYRAYTGNDAWVVAEAVTRAASSLTNAFIVLEYKENGVDIVRVVSNMFHLSPSELKELSTGVFTVTEAVKDVSGVATVTVALKGMSGSDKVDASATLKSEMARLAAEKQKEQQAVELKARELHSEAVKVMSSLGYVVGELKVLQSESSRAFGLDKCTHTFDVFVGGGLDE